MKAILDVNHIQLHDGRIIRLIGVKPHQDHTEAALAFLSKKILKRPIYLRYDEIRYDRESYEMAYVYMKNKTFINLHLLKNGFADVDTEYQFKYRAKFENSTRSSNI